MEDSTQKYELAQNGKKYVLAIEIVQDKLRFSCTDFDPLTPLTFVGNFPLFHLKKLGSMFAYISSLSEAQNIFDEIISSQRVSIEQQQNYVNLQILINRGELSEETFSLQLNLNNGTNTEFPIFQQSNYQSFDENNKIYSQEELQNQFLSFFPNNEISNDNNYYSTDNNYPEQYAQYPQSSPTQNLYYNNNLGNTVNYNYNSPVKNYENSILHKSRRTRVDKLTLSLKPQVENEINEQTPTFQPNNYDNNNIIETDYQTSEQIYTSIPKQNDIINNEKDKIIENLQNEINKLNLEISQLRSQNELLKQENENLKLQYQVIKNTQDGNQSKEIIFKKEKESYIKEIENLRNQLGKLNEFEEYKRIKEEEISILKTQIEELLSNQRRIEDYTNQKQREIDELKLYIEELLKKQKQNEYEYQNMLRQTQQRETNTEDQMLSIQDTRLEVVKGDIIQNTKELELLTRKISKNNKKITLNLLYKATVDSDKAQAFHNKCDSVNNSLVLVKSANGKRFGGYTTCNWRGNNIEKRDENAFVFSLDKLKTYDVIPGEDAIGCYPKYGPVFLGCQIRLYDEFFTKGGTTYEKGLNYNTEEDFELSGGLNKFEVKDVEVYGVEIE
jgi:hypothetical protein